MIPLGDEFESYEEFEDHIDQREVEDLYRSLEKEVEESNEIDD